MVEQTLRLRGGQTSSDAPAGNALTRDQITEKLNAVPVFCIVNENGGLVGTRDKEGKEAICWFTDAAESKVIYRLAQPMRSSPEPDEAVSCVLGIACSDARAQPWLASSSGCLRLGDCVPSLQGLAR